MKPYVYIVVRKDIKQEYLAPQLCHAALGAGYSFDRPEITTHLVLLQVDTKMELDMVAQGLQAEGVPFEEFYEGFGNMGLTALATAPMPKPAIGWLRELKLFSFK